MPDARTRYSLQEHRRRHIYSAALLEVTQMVKQMKPDDLLISHIYRRLALAVCEAYDLPPPSPEPEQDSF